MGSFALVAADPIGLYVAPKGFLGSSFGAGSAGLNAVPLPPKGLPGSALGVAGLAGLNGLDSSGFAASGALNAELIAGEDTALGAAEGVAAALGNPDEAGVAAALGNPEDAGVAAALGKPDEAGVAAALGNPEDAGALGASSALGAAGLNAELIGAEAVAGAGSALGADAGVVCVLANPPALGNPDDADALGASAALGAAGLNAELMGADAVAGAGSALGVAAVVVCVLAKPPALGNPDDAGALGASSALGADLNGLGFESAAPGALNAELMGADAEAGAGSALGVPTVAAGVLGNTEFLGGIMDFEGSDLGASLVSGFADLEGAAPNLNVVSAFNFSSFSESEISSGSFSVVRGAMDLLSSSFLASSSALALAAAAAIAAAVAGLV